MVVPDEKLHFYRLCGTSMYSKVLGLFSLFCTLLVCLALSVLCSLARQLFLYSTRLISPFCTLFACTSISVFSHLAQSFLYSARLLSHFWALLDCSGLSVFCPLAYSFLCSAHLLSPFCTLLTCSSFSVLCSCSALYAFLSTTDPLLYQFCLICGLFNSVRTG